MILHDRTGRSAGKIRQHPAGSGSVREAERRNARARGQRARGQPEGKIFLRAPPVGSGKIRQNPAGVRKYRMILHDRTGRSAGKIRQDPAGLDRSARSPHKILELRPVSVKWTGGLTSEGGNGAKCFSRGQPGRLLNDAASHRASCRMQFCDTADSKRGYIRHV